MPAPDQPAPGSPEAGGAAPLADLSVLVVDDDPFMLEVAGEMLRQLGVSDIRQASDGDAALAGLAAGPTPPGVILADIHMAGMDGIELLRHLAAEQYPGAVILMSGSGGGLLGSVGDLALVHGLTLLGTLAKPVEPSLLRDLLAAVGPARGRPAAEPAPVLGGGLSAEELRRGLEGGAVEVHFQPKVSVADRRVLGAEALLRWRDPERGILPPPLVVASAEAHGLIDQLTLAVYSMSIQWLAEVNSSGHEARFSVNLSTNNLLSLDFPDTLAAIAREAGVQPSQVILEITEHRLMDQLSTSLEVIGRLRLKGFGLSIDDYGIGYSNPAKLKALPLTELKVDRSFVNGANRDSVLRTILGSSVALGHSLGLMVVGEGVEDQEMWDLLAALGCDEAQGYFVARPMPPADFMAWWEEWDRARRPVG